MLISTFNVVAVNGDIDDCKVEDLVVTHDGVNVLVSTLEEIS